MLSPKGIKANTSPINSTTKKKKLELDALTGLFEGLHVCIKLIWRGRKGGRGKETDLNHLFFQLVHV